jgi:rSAM/selenodomain-associated transferase 1
MAKAPRGGAVKTRLVPPLSGDEAAILSTCFLKDITENFVLVAEQVPARGFVAFTPPGTEAIFRELLPASVGMLPSRRIGLGLSLFDAAADLLGAGYGAACLVNADSPTLPTSTMLAAATALRAPGDRVVLGPAIDGGYYLIGLKHAYAALFEDIAWSTERVFRQTVERATSLGLPVVTLPIWYDVDDETSLGWLCQELLAGRRVPEFASVGYGAPHTAAYLRYLVAAKRISRRALGEALDERVAP